VRSDSSSFPCSRAGGREIQWAAASAGSASSRGGGGGGRELQEGRRRGAAAASRARAPAVASLAWRRGAGRWRRRGGRRGASRGVPCASCAGAVEEKGEAEEQRR